MSSSKKPMLLTEFDSAGFTIHPEAQEILQRLSVFMKLHVFPSEAEIEAHDRSKERWTVPSRIEALKQKAKSEGLWNLFIPPEMAEEIHKIDDLTPEEKTSLSGVGLTNLEYAFMAEVMGACLWASEVFNCNAPDTGNMEILAKYFQRHFFKCVSFQIWNARTEKGMAGSIAQRRNAIVFWND